MISDYTLREEIDEKGRFHTAYQYTGKPYRFGVGQSAALAEGRKLLVLMVSAWAAYVLAMLLPSEAMHNLYVALPFVFTAVPLFLLTETLLQLRKLKEPLEKRHADRMNHRYPPQALMAAVFPCFALLGELIVMIMGNIRLPGDVVFVICALWLCFAGVRCFRSRKTMEIVFFAENGVK